MKIQVQLKILKINRDNVTLILMAESGNATLWKWHIVGNLKGAQELFKIGEFLGGFRREDGWLIDVQVWSGRVSRMTLRCRQDISTNK